MIEEKNGKKVYIFAKDKNGKFLFCNEAHAYIAGMDSPEQIAGKTDFDVFWEKNAHKCRGGDLKTINTGISIVDSIEHLTRYDGTFDIVISKYQLKDENGNCIGITGSYYDLTKTSELHLKKGDESKRKKIYLGKDFNDEYFTIKEYEVFKQLILGKCNKQIARDAKISPKTVEYHVDNIKKKLQCVYKKDIVYTAIRHGLLYMPEI